MKTDRVLTVNEYYDGPRLGVAELGGEPHVYQAEFDRSADEYSGTYVLSPIQPDLLALVLEDWEIWCRWHAAYSGGKATLESHPALPEERARHEELVHLIGNRLQPDPANCHRFKALFTTQPGWSGSWTGTLVQWSPHDA